MRKKKHRKDGRAQVRTGRQGQEKRSSKTKIEKIETKIKLTLDKKEQNP